MSESHKDSTSQLDTALSNKGVLASKFITTPNDRLLSIEALREQMRTQDALTDNQRLRVRLLLDFDSVIRRMAHAAVLPQELLDPAGIAKASADIYSVEDALRNICYPKKHYNYLKRLWFALLSKDLS